MKVCPFSDGTLHCFEVDCLHCQKLVDAVTEANAELREKVTVADNMEDYWTHLRCGAN